MRIIQEMLGLETGKLQLLHYQTTTSYIGLIIFQLSY